MTLEEKIDSLLDRMARIETALKYDGEGLIPAFREHCTSDEKFREDYYRFKRRAIAVLAFVVGAGGLGVGGWQVVSFLS